MSPFAIRRRIPNAAYELPKAPTRRLGSLPGPRASWWLGEGVRFLRDDGPLIAENVERFGPIFALPFPLGARTAVMVGADANRLVLGNAGKIFASHPAYRGADLFGDAIVARDLEDHYELRRLIAPAFGPPALREALVTIRERTAAHLATLPARGGVVELYPFAKRLALEIAARVFAGLELGPDRERILQALVDTLDMAGVLFRVPIPGSATARGRRGRRRAEAYFASRVPERRHGSGNDFFTLLCRAENAAGERLADSEIVDNVVGAMIAGHDTSTIAMASLAYRLAEHPDWQERVRKEIEGATHGAGPDGLDLDTAAQLREVECCVRETLRLHTPIRTILRRSLAAFEFHGHEVPRNAAVLVSVHHTHHDEAEFRRAAAFAPERFSDDPGALGAHDAFAFAPFGKGAHQCLGIHFAMLEIKVFLSALLSRYRLELTSPEPLRVEGLPVSKPTTGVPLRLVPL